jgi:predicted secreted Zn-dependent protease
MLTGTHADAHHAGVAGGKMLACLGVKQNHAAVAHVVYKSVYANSWRKVKKLRHNQLCRLLSGRPSPALRLHLMARLAMAVPSVLHAPVNWKRIVHLPIVTTGAELPPRPRWLDFDFLKR